ncbi:filamentous hemagglutinin N-terminal domain-containing protein [Hydrogenophaga borbori]|uniref:filamentous hemagglutinin N-terminal domain-containing protein n=1 Tax=Hydrogenophaga borbori TaxID=2294117 RepID=UPI00301D3FD3
MSSKTRQRMVFQRMAMAVAVAMGAWSIGTPAWPQIVADPGAPGRQRPTVLPAGQGVALVNIQTPSAAGVSRNSYRQFDVGAAGAILNNSRGQAQTQLGGWVAGNPWLATGGARIILNEVNSSDPSWLKGPIEVAGQRAEVVIANPSGIQVDGAAFLNASGVTLTTGTPVFNGGALDAYLVQGGQVRVEGAGLDARGADATAILARATQLNAALWAQRLTLVSGANTIDAASQRPTGAAPPTGEAPAFALDVAAVGGMYAGQIQLIGTEAGLGVNNQGVISAESGPLQLRADGWLVNKGSLQSEGELQVKAQGVDNAAGAVIVGERVGLGADTVNNGEGAVIAARGDLSIQARESISNRRGGLILSGADMALAAERIENRSARIEALGELDVNQDSEIVAGGVLNTPGAAVDNQASEVAASLTRRGTAYTWGVVDHTCEGLSGLRVHADLSRPLQHVAPIHARIPLAGAVTSATGLRLVSRQFADALLLRRVQLPVVQVGAERRARSRCAPCRTGCQADSRGHAQPRDAFGYVGVQAGAFQGSLHLVLQVIEGGCRQAGSTRARRGARAAGQPTDHRVPHRAVRAAFVPLVGLGQQLGTGRVVDIKPRGVLPLLVALLVGHVAPALGEHRQAVLCDGHLRIDPVLDLLLVKDRRDAALRVSRAGVLVARDARDARFGGAARAALVFAPACATGPARPGHRPRCAGR